MEWQGRMAGRLGTVDCNRSIEDRVSELERRVEQAGENDATAAHSALRTAKVAAWAAVISALVAYSHLAMDLYEWIIEQVK